MLFNDQTLLKPEALRCQRIAIRRTHIECSYGRRTARYSIPKEGDLVNQTVRKEAGSSVTASNCLGTCRHGKGGFSSEMLRTHRVFARGIAVLAVLVAVAVVSVRCGAHGVERFEGGTAHKTDAGAHWVLTLKGTWREMGRQYGGLVGDELRQFLAEITEDVAGRGMPLDEQLENARSMAATFSLNLNELLKGMAESSGLSEDEVLVLNAGICMLSTVVLGGERPSACSGLAVWDEYTPDGALVFGRNWDIERESLRPYMKYLSVVVFNPDSGNAFANVHPLGNVYLETGMNEKGLFIELNNGAYSDPSYIEGVENTVSVLVTALNQCSTIDEASEYLLQTPADLSYIIQIADAKECVSVERATVTARVRKTEQQGVLAAYNSFVPPYPEGWTGLVTDPLPGEIDPRYSNLIKLANSDGFRGKLDVQGMKGLMDIEVRDGGATHRGTVFQVIAVPEELALWIRALDCSDWRQVNLRELFADW